MQPGDGQPGLTDCHLECIKLTNRQVANSQLTDSKGQKRIAISQTQSDTRPGNKLTSSAGDKHVQAGSQVVQGDRQQTHGYMADY